MIVLTSLVVSNYKNASGTLDGLRDLNIFIGPNNCGKTSLLESINLLTKLVSGKTGGYINCQYCQELYTYQPAVLSSFYSVQPREKLFEKEMPSLKFSFSSKYLDNNWPLKVKNLRELLSTLSDHPENVLSLRCPGSPNQDNVHSEHVSLYSIKEVSDGLKNAVVYIPEGRLKTYKEKNIREYLVGKNLKHSESDKLFNYLKVIGVNTRIHDSDSAYNLIEKVGNAEFNSKLDDQGSGVRSIICLLVDMISAREAQIFLMDEPELGLNPSAKQQLLALLLAFSKESQVFFTTHDPTFVNPILWKGQDERVKVFLYSTIDEGFKKIDLIQNGEDPETFAGYLPHTVSLKDVHIYVEGASDVYIFQIFLRKYLQQKHVEDWMKWLNRVGIFHLAGDFWQHLLYTVPRSPYRCIVVLDQEKIPKARNICERYAKSGSALPSFGVITKTDHLKEWAQYKDEPGREMFDVPIYCLAKMRIELYLDPLPPNLLSQGYNKKVDGPRIAEAMKYVPDEITQIFHVMLDPSNDLRKISPS